MLNFALVGCGGMANWHAQQLQKISDVKVVALVDPLHDHVANFKNKYFNDAAEFDSYEKLLGDPPAKLDAVVLVTPHAFHYPQAKTALESGINVLTEKPMVTDVDQAIDLWHTAKRTGRKLGIAFQAPYTPEYQCLAQMRDSGRLGKINLISGWLSQNWMSGTKGTWRQEPSMSGGGQLYDAGAHVINSIVWLANSPPVEVACFYDHCGAPVEINGVAIIKFASGTMASLTIGGCAPHWDTMVLMQTDKLVVKTGPHGGWLELTGPHGRKSYPQIEDCEHAAAGTPHLNFVQALKGEQPIQCPARYGVLHSALMDAMYQAARTGTIAKVRPLPQDL
jgi:predicted dehydrogenase